MGSKSDREQLLEIFDSIDFENIKKHPNILIAAAFWEPERYRAACSAYRFLRSADDLVDNYKIKHPVIGKQGQAILVENLGKLTGQLSSKSGDVADRELAGCDGRRNAVDRQIGNGLAFFYWADGQAPCPTCPCPYRICESAQC